MQYAVSEFELVHVDAAAVTDCVPLTPTGAPVELHILLTSPVAGSSTGQSPL